MNVIKFTFLKYINFILLFIRGYLISYFLTYEKYAAWGIVMFVISYHSIAGFGIPKIVLTKLKDNNSQKFSSNLLGTSVFYIFLLCIIFLILFRFSQIFIEWNINEQFSVESLIILSALLLINDSFVNAARYKKLYNLIIITESISIIPLIVLLIIFGENIKVDQCIYIMIFSISFSILIYYIFVKLRFKVQNIIPYLNLIKNLGIPLLFFNYASYIIFILLRYFVLEKYDDQVISNFNFGWFISNAIVMGISTVTWYFYPMLLKNLKEFNKKNKFSFDDLYYLQLVVSLFLVIVSIPFFKYFTYNFYDKFELSLIHFRFVLISQLIFYLSTYPSSFLIANDKKKELILSGIISALFFGLYVYVKIFYENLTIESLYVGLIISSIIFLFSISHNVKMKNKRSYFYISIILFSTIAFNTNNFTFLILFVILVFIVKINFFYFKNIISSIINENRNF